MKIVRIVDITVRYVNVKTVTKMLTIIVIVIVIASIVTTCIFSVIVKVVLVFSGSSRFYPYSKELFFFLG